MNALLGPFAPLLRRLNRPAVGRLIVIPAILLLGAFLRFHLLDHQSLWSDEGNSLRLAQRSLPDLITVAKFDIHPPGYYIALSAWRVLTGDSEFALRALSAFAGVLTIACVYALGRTLFSRGAGMIAALLVAVNGFNVYYGQEARMYAALALFAAVSMLAFVHWINRPNSLRIGVVLALVNAAGLYTQYSYPAVMVTQGVMFLGWLVIERFRKPTPTAISALRSLGIYVGINLLTIALFAPQLGTAITQVTGWPRTGQPVELGKGLGTVAQWLIYGNTLLPLPWWMYGWPALFLLAAILPDWLSRSRSVPPGYWSRLLPWLWILITVAPFFALGLFRDANLKFLLPAQIAVALLIGRGIWLLWELGSPNFFLIVEALPRFAAAIGLFFMLTVARDVLQNLYQNPLYARPDYRAIARQIAADPQPDDAIVLDAPNQWEVFTYYYSGSVPIYPLPKGLGGDDAETSTAIDAVIADHRRIFVLYWGESERDPNLVVENTLAAKAFQVSSEWKGDVRFVVYATRPSLTTAPLALDARFGESITLKTVTLTATTLHPGEVLGVIFTWTTTQSLTQRYKIFVQLLDKDGRLAVPSSDSEPGGNLAITTTWTPGQPVVDSHAILIPPDVAPGDYTLITGVYDFNDPGKRLYVNGRDNLTLGIIQISDSTQK